MKQIKKTIYELSTEELIAVIEGNGPPIQGALIVDKTVDDFVKKTGIKPGTQLAPCWFLLSVYRLITNRPIRPNKFFKDLAALGFRKKKTRYETYYFLNKIGLSKMRIQPL